MVVRNETGDPMIGMMIHDYQIVEKLAEGGMGAVYVARQQHLEDTKKVIKVLLPEYAKNPIIRERFEREAKAVSRLKHDRIIGIDGFGVLHDGQLWLRMPFLTGQSLDSYLRERGGQISAHRAIHIFLQVCDALDFAHARGVIHRDIKPQNVFVERTNQNWATIKLLDFGIAKVIGAQDLSVATRAGMSLGTPSYMAVEQYERADEVTPAADVYSLAVMMWEMVTGALPWQASDQAVLYYQQREVVPQRPPETVMLPAWADILLRALSPRPSDRHQSVRELAIELASALPAIGRVPSGAEILSSIAPHFVKNASPADDTLRNASDVNRLGPLLWPTNETGVGAPQVPPPLNVAASSSRPPGTPAMAATANERRPATTPVPSRPTTLTAASGVTSEASPRPYAQAKPPRRWVALAALLVIAAAVAGIAIVVSTQPASDKLASSPADAAAVSATHEATVAVASDARAAAPQDAAESVAVVLDAPPPPDAAIAVVTNDAATAPADVAPRDEKPIAPAAKGWIVVSVTAPDANIYIDGKLVGQAAIRYKVTAGAHSVTLESGAQREKIKVNVKANKPTVIQRQW